MTYASACGISRCARSRPIATAPLTASDTSGLANGSRPVDPLDDPGDHVGANSS
jgi:hypothetical protein